MGRSYEVEGDWEYRDKFMRASSFAEGPEQYAYRYEE